MTDLSRDEASLPAGTKAVMEFAREHPDIFRWIDTEVAQAAIAKSERRQSIEYDAQLLDRVASFKTVRDFEVGDLVQWKPSLRNRHRPEYGERAFVFEVREHPRYNDKRDPGSPYYMEQLDLVLGILDDDDELVFYHFDSRRFEKAPSLDREYDGQ